MSGQLICYIYISQRLIFSSRGRFIYIKQSWIMNKFSFFSVIFILLSLRGYSQFTWEHTDGPFGSVLSILYANDDFIFSPEVDFIFRSADGIHWEKLNHPGTTIFAVTKDTLGTLVRDQQNNKIQLHLSLDNGENWIIRDLPAPFTDYNVNIVFSGSIISLGNFNRQSIFRSEDFGLHWTEHPYPRMEHYDTRYL